MYFIKPCIKTNSTLTLSSNSSIIRQLDKVQKKWTIKFGVKTFEVKVIVSDSVKDHHVVLSNNVINELGIPLTCFYDIFNQDGEIVIGPFIGILAEITNKKLVKNLSMYNSFVKGYKYIGGAIIVFSLEGIREEDQTVSGFLYEPDKDSWVFGTFPYPGVVMSILEASLTLKWREFHRKMKHFMSILGPKVFNYPHFSKWEMHCLLCPKLGNVLPETILYKDTSDISKMLYLYNSIYIKPLNGRLGRHIYKVKRVGSKIVVQSVHKRKKQVKYFANKDEMIAFFKQNLIPEEFLIQQTIPLMMHENRVIDFRVMMVKNEAGIWENLGIFSRYSAEGAIVSNITAGGHTEPAGITLQKVWNLSEEEVVKVKEKIEKVVRESLHLFEQNGYHCGNIGFDIGLDENRSVYIIEINHQNPDPYIAVIAKKRKVFYTARLKNMLYAKYLEGYK